MVTVIPIVIGELGTIPKGLVRGMEELEIGGRAETIRTIKLLLYLQSFDRNSNTNNVNINVQCTWFPNL